jgi:hypothetical protein
VSGRRHVHGVCTCLSHVDRPWNRSEHWKADEVEYLERWFGRRSDAAIARRLGRSVVGIRLKAKRLGLHKKDAGYTAHGVAQVFGVDPTTVVDRWIAQGALRARRAAFRQGPKPVWLVDEAELERFIRDQPERIDVDKMPDSIYREMAARDPWISLPEVHRRTGRSPHAVARLIAAGAVRGRRRGAHWYIPEADVAKVPPIGPPERVAESVFRRESVLERRRNVRKGIARQAFVRPPRPRLLSIRVLRGDAAAAVRAELAS